jgi:hypothetical protein
VVCGCGWIEEKLRDRGWAARRGGDDLGGNFAEAGGCVFSVLVGAGADELAASGSITVTVVPGSG